ncbi:ankyrin repeat-containing domain protein [Fusarium sp. MPI-SDFR-AT-0072]|nr:ankyrin repeat-containing domain protein [Fusarium sp. MPI-SDFR-AT-0072]
MLFNGYAFSHPGFVQFSRACREGDMSTVESIVTSPSRTPAFLHEGLFNALGSGKVDVARYLLDSGAPITRVTPSWALAAPKGQQKPLFELFLQHGWSVNTPGFYGAVLLPPVIRAGNDALLDWFLENGADPNLGKQQDNRDRFGEPETNSCEALETAAVMSTVETVQKLLNAGAKIDNGAPLYYAAGACPPGSNPHAGLVTPSKEFDESRISVIALLVKNGARVNDKLISRHMTAQYPIVNAVMAGAIERVKWLLSQGADPDMKGQFGSARDYARKFSSGEMKRVLQVL